MLVPLLSLVRRAVATEGTDARAGTFSIQLADVVASRLESCERPASHSDLFEASKMKKLFKSLMAMKVSELKGELEERGEAKSGNKAWLRRARGGSNAPFRNCARVSLESHR